MTEKFHGWRELRLPLITLIPSPPQPLTMFPTIAVFLENWGSGYAGAPPSKARHFPKAFLIVQPETRMLLALLTTTRSPRLSEIVRLMNDTCLASDDTMTDSNRETVTPSDGVSGRKGR